MKDCKSTEGWKLAQLKTKEHIANLKNLRIIEYNKNPSTCKHCESVLDYGKRKYIFCSRSCSQSHNNIGVRRRKNENTYELYSVQTYCKCGNMLLNSSRKYCSRKCQRIYIKNKYIQYWIDNQHLIKELPNYVRRYLLLKADNKCCKCGWGEKNPYSGNYALVIDHIDGNSENNREDNLRVLCARCDSMSSTYMGLNRGKGRKKRRDRYLKNK